MRAYYNEHDPHKAAWLRNLIASGAIAPGEVDERDVADVQPSDLRGFRQVHLFAGIGGWSLALRIADWPDYKPVWTASAPCRFKSSAARGRNVAPDLWVHVRRLLDLSCPLFGEQVANARGWFDGVCDDLEALGYTVGAAVLPACAVAQDHARERLFFVGHPNRESQSILSKYAEMDRLSRRQRRPRVVSSADGIPGGVARVRAGYGDAIVPQLAAEFIRAYREAA